MARKTGDLISAYRSRRPGRGAGGGRQGSASRPYTYTATRRPSFFNSTTRSDVPVLPHERTDIIRPRNLTANETSPWRRAYAEESLSPYWWSGEAVNWAGVPSAGGGYQGPGAYPYVPPIEDEPYYGGYGDGGGGGGGGPVDVTWTTGSYAATGQNVPSWWKAMVPTDRALLERPDVAWAVMMNAMIPYLSPEDQARIANQLYTVWGKGFEGYAPSAVTAGELAMDPDFAFMTGQAMPDTSYFMGTQRSADAMATLADLLAKEAGGDINKVGAGYRWLQDMLGGISETGGGSTRQQYMEMLSNVDPLLASAKSGELAAYGPLGEALIRPYFTNFRVRPTTQAGGFGRERGSKYLYL